MLNLEPTPRGIPKALVVLLVLAALAVGVFFAPRPALAQGTLSLLAQLNGTPVKVGTLTSTGGSVTNATTGTPFTTLKAGDIIAVECDAAACVGPGTAASCTATSASYLPKVSASPDLRYFVLTGTSVAAISVSGTANCAVFRMQ